MPAPGDGVAGLLDQASNAASGYLLEDLPGPAVTAGSHATEPGLTDVTYDAAVA